MDEHILKVHGVQCKFCYKFLKSTVVDEHIALFHTIKCRYCPEKFAKDAVMNAHVKSVHALQCKFCQEFVKDTTMNEHIAIFHAIKCRFCPKKFVESTAMDEHIALLHLIKCRFCSEKFAIGADMNAHVKSDHAIKCPFCPAKFLTIKDLDQHRKIHDEKSEIEIKCHLCNKCVKSTAMDKHIASIHGADMNAHVSSVHAVKCQYNGLTMKSEFTKEKDMENESSDPLNILSNNVSAELESEKPNSTFLEEKLENGYECNYCNTFFSTKGNLKTHQKRSCTKIVHEGMKCPFCPENFAKHPDMYKHISSVHAIKCQLCPAKLFTNEDMDQHITSHEKNQVPLLPRKI